MAIQNQGFRRDLNLSETEDDRTAFDNLAGAGSNLDIAVIRNNLRNTSSIPFYAVDSEGFFSTADKRIISLNSISTDGNIDAEGNKTTTISVVITDPFLIKFGDLVSISGVNDGGSDVLNGFFTVEGTSNDLKTFTFTKTGIAYTSTENQYQDTGNIEFSIASNDIFSFTEDDVINVSTEVTFTSGGTSVTLSPNTNYYATNSDGLTKFKLSTTRSTAGSNVVAIPNNATANPNQFIFTRKDPVNQPQIINYISPNIQDERYRYLDGNAVNTTIDTIQSRVENSQLSMSEKYRGDQDTNTNDSIKFEGSVVINDPKNYNSDSPSILNPNNVLENIRKSPGIYIGDVRAFSSDNNPRDKVGTALTTSAEEVSIGELSFLDGTNSIVIDGLASRDKDTLVIADDISDVNPAEVATSFTHKIPIKVQDANGNQETYSLLLSDA